MPLFGAKKDKKSEGAKSNPGRQYFNTVYALSRSARAWRFATIIMGAAVLFMIFQTIAVTRSMPVRLIPYDYAINKNIAEVSDLGEVTADYLGLVASADVSLLNNWTPATIKIQYRRFLNRCAPELYARQQVELINEADKKAKTVRVQAFFPREIKVVNGNQVQVSGRLKRWAAGEELGEEPITFVVDYRFLHGVPYIHSIHRGES